MSDDDIRSMREEAASGQTATARLFVELADEALARGVVCCELAEELNNLRERVAQLETTLRFYGEHMTYKASAGCEYWLVPIEQDKGEKARAALAAGKS